MFTLPMGTCSALPWARLHCAVNTGGRGLPGHKVFYGIQFVFTLLLLLFYSAVIGVLSTKVPLKYADYDSQWRSLDY